MALGEALDGTSTALDVVYCGYRDISLRAAACGDEYVFLLMAYGIE